MGVDVLSFPGVTVVTDLRQPWPWSDGTVDEIHCSHFLEHLDAMERVHFWNELYRVLKPGAKATIITPHWSSSRAYGDPSHKWPAVCEFSFLYLNKEWRMVNAPHTDAQNVPWGFKCNFQCTWGYALHPEVALRNQEYQQHAMTFFTEARQDTHCTATKA